jgi:tyrosyl-tRNA synthetase
MNDTLSLDEKINLIQQVGEEINTEEDLVSLLKQTESTNERPVAYDGFEPSGQMHIAQGILRTININKMIKAGFKFRMYVADWHAYLNNKLGGDLEKIQTTGKYFIEVWKACGMNVDHVEFVWASDLVKKDGYWDIVMRIATETSLKRILRTTQIMGRSEADDLSAAQILYPLMQAADIFMLNARVTQLGMDQRKVNMLARQVAEKVGYEKPVVVSNHMLLGLGKPATDTGDALERAIELKMSKSKPDTAIFMTDTLEDIQRKISKAWCPEGIIEENPVLEYCKYILFERFDKIVVDRPEKWGGPLTFTNYNELEKIFASGELHPMDLKNSVASLLNELLIPIRKHFDEDVYAKGLLEQVQSFQVTR